MKRIILTALVVTGLSAMTIPETKAFEPVTMAILAPYAIDAAKVVAPYAMKGVGNVAEGIGRMFGEMVNIFLLPVGVIECTLGLPFGFWSSGIGHIAKGFMAPFQLTYEALMLPMHSIAVF